MVDEGCCAVSFVQIVTKPRFRFLSHLPTVFAILSVATVLINYLAVNSQISLYLFVQFKFLFIISFLLLQLFSVVDTTRNLNEPKKIFCCLNNSTEKIGSGGVVVRIFFPKTSGIVAATFFVCSAEHSPI